MREIAEGAKASHWAQLDTLRLILAGIVFCGHFHQVFIASVVGSASLAFAVFGFLARAAVLGFFVLSGLVICRSLILKSDDPDTLLLEFTSRRAARILPPLLASVALVFVLGLILQSTGLARYTGFASLPARDSYDYHLAWVRDSLLSFGFRGDLTGLANGPLWSLALELQLYAIAGLAFQTWHSRSVWHGMPAACCLWVALRHTDIGNCGIDLCYGSFGLGMAVYAAQLYRRGREMLLLLASFALSACLGLMFLAPASIAMLDASAFWLSAQTAVVSAFAALVVWLVGSERSLLPVFSTDFSYSLYIFHFPILLFFFFLFYNRSALSPWTEATCWLVSTGAVLLVSYGAGAALENRRTMNAISARTRLFLSRVPALDRRSAAISRARLA
jgi:peptidoglycan/LPS O-acetylase OafA/YrhL